VQHNRAKAELKETQARQSQELTLSANVPHTSTARTAHARPHMPTARTAHARVLTLCLGLGFGAQSKPVTPKRILVAEDNSINKRVILRFLERRGHYCEAADNGEEALSIYLDAVAKGRRFDLIFMDIEMVRVVSCCVLRACRAVCRVAL
jgi:PleD family two-component response regulator